jgi:hypothetical protein
MNSTGHGGMSFVLFLNFHRKSRLRTYMSSRRNRYAISYSLRPSNPVRKERRKTERKKERKKGRTDNRRSAVASWIFLLLIRSKHRTNWRQGKRTRHDIYLNVVIPRIVRWVFSTSTLQLFRNLVVISLVSFSPCCVLFNHFYVTTFDLYTARNT